MIKHNTPAQTEQQGSFTGWHMLGIMIAFFGVIIVVNLIMATSAIRSWSGLVVQNSYVASQEFNKKSITGKAHAALNWREHLTYENGLVTYRLTDANGKPVRVTGATAVFRRPVNEKEDQTLNMLPSAGNVLTAEADLKDGNWVVEVNTYAGLEEPYRQIHRINISNGLFVIKEDEQDVKGSAQ
ncbi:FixH family protein [Pseudochrobactrum sp. HB0163]|uniref:FixH family protein n=1 Tax=Pseudochrobactrum sp. HB0163 TaxID=3450708 RepID=UPI003F6E1445